MTIKDIIIEKIIHSKRKTISIKINSAGQVIIYAPEYLSNYELHKAINTKYEWIKKHRKDVLENKKITIHKYEEGEVFFFLGEEFRLKFITEPNIRLVEEKKLIEINPDCDRSYVIKQFYKNMAKQYVLKIAYQISERLKKYPDIYKISCAEKSLGSCSTDGKINLSYQLLMFPKRIIEYVVIHELAHLKEHNHSKRFWKNVEEMMPDYRKHLKFIKDNQHIFKL